MQRSLLPPYRIEEARRDSVRAQFAPVRLRREAMRSAAMARRRRGVFPPRPGHVNSVEQQLVQGYREAAVVPLMQSLARGFIARRRAQRERQRLSDRLNAIRVGRRGGMPRYVRREIRSFM